jgi:hypothetical protein
LALNAPACGSPNREIHQLADASSSAVVFMSIPLSMLSTAVIDELMSSVEYKNEIKSDNSSHLIEPYFAHKSSISFRYWLDYQEHTKHIYHIFSGYCQISIDIIWYKYMHIKKV